MQLRVGKQLPRDPTKVEILVEEYLKKLLASLKANEKIGSNTEIFCYKEKYQKFILKQDKYHH